MATETIDKLTLIMESCNAIVDHPDSPEHDKTFALEIQAWADDCKPLLSALKDAEAFVDSHSEEWYTSGQKTLAHIRDAIVHATEKEPQ